MKLRKDSFWKSSKHRKSFQDVESSQSFTPWHGFAWNYAETFSQNFLSRKLGQITAFYVAFAILDCFISLIKCLNLYFASWLKRSKRECSAQITNSIISLSIHEKHPYSEFFWSVFSRIWSISPYSVWIRENRTSKIPNIDTFHLVIFNWQRIVNSLVYHRGLQLYRFFYFFCIDSCI